MTANFGQPGLERMGLWGVLGAVDPRCNDYREAEGVSVVSLNVSR